MLTSITLTMIATAWLLLYILWKKEFTIIIASMFLCFSYLLDFLEGVLL